MENANVLILLASYNGEAYLRPMIDSLLAQDYPNIQLIVSDDNSSDRSEAILAEYAQAYPDKITHYQSGMRFGCAQKHFLHLLQTFHAAPYIMFCDQDDVWHCDKVSRTLARMRETEAAADVPALVHTDLRVVDGNLSEISSSFCSHSALDGTRLQLNRLLVQNVVTGCTIMLNRALAELACRGIPEDAVLMHDWWLALLASACGKIAFLPEATIDYRQHGSNSVGAKNVRSPQYLWKRLSSRKMRESLQGAARQAEAFARCYEDLLTQEQLQLLHAFATTQKLSLSKRDRIYLKYGLIKYGAVRVAAQFLGW